MCICIAVPAVVEDLECPAMDDVLSIMWSPPKSGQAVFYRVTVLEYADGSNTVISKDINPPFVEEVTNMEVQSPTLRELHIYYVISYLHVFIFRNVCSLRCDCDEPGFSKMQRGQE